MLLDLLAWLFVEPLFHCLHAVFSLQYPTRTAAMARLKFLIAMILVLSSGCMAGSIVLVWIGVPWIWAVASFVIGFLSCHLLAGLADQLDAEARAAREVKSPDFSSDVPQP